MDSDVVRFLQVRLINSVAQNEHVIDADTDQQERHELMHTSSLATADVHETKARSVGEEDTEKS